MKQVVIDNPVINSPFEERNRHFCFTDEGITNEIVESRRKSAYFIPIAAPKKKSKQAQLPFATEISQDRGEGEINLIIEVTGENKKDKPVKVFTARPLWVPAINNHGDFVKWVFLEIADPWNAINEIRKWMDQPREDPS